LALAEMIVEKEPRPHEPGRALLGRVPQDDAHEPVDHLAADIDLA
jgi:hypothetical protein